MRKLYLFVSCAITAGALCINSVHAQSFNKGSLLISLSEGTTHTSYSTGHVNDNEVSSHEHINGDRDPITVEYGISRKWGAGINIGTDIINVNPSMYGFSAPTKRVKAFMSEFTLDANYHFLTNNLIDLSACLSAGASSVTIKGGEGDRSYQYNAGGGIVRVGTKARYYLCKRFGLLGMLSAYSSSTSPKGIGGNTVGSQYTTRINGYALEFGLCYRILK